MRNKQHFGIELEEAEEDKPIKALNGGGSDTADTMQMGKETFIWRVAEESDRLGRELEAIVLEHIMELKDMNTALENEISERNKIENELRVEKYFMEAVFDSIPGLLFLYNENNRLIYWNKKHEELTGYTAQELYKKNMKDWFKDNPESIGAISCSLKTLSETGKAEVEADILKKDGSGIPMLFSAVRLEYNGRMYLTGIGIDITECKKKEKENEYLRLAGG